MEVVEFKTSKKMDAYIKSLIEKTHSDKTFKEGGQKVFEAAEEYNAVRCNCGDYTESLLNTITGGEFSATAVSPKVSFEVIKANKDKIQEGINKFQKENKLE